MREYKEPAQRPATGSMFVVMACSDMQEADQISRCLSELNTGCLVTYLKVEDLVMNAASGTVALVILATDDSAPVLGKTLDWLRHRWPRCPITVVSDAGCGEHEMAAREGGASFLTRPVSPGQWMAILAHAFSKAREGQASETDPGQYAPVR